MFDILKAMKWKVCYIESHNAKQGLNTHHVVALLEQMKSIKHCRITYLGKTTDRGERYLWKLEKTNYVDK
jgi:hypothetical protein